MKKAKSFKLKKELGLLMTTLYGVGIIVGAGIYVIIGAGAGIAGNAVWLSFAVAALLAFFTGFSYAELASMYPKDAAEYVYTERAFRKPLFSFSVQWVMIAAGIISAATVALGFGSYWAHIFGGSPVLAAAALIALLSLVSYIGIKQSAEFNIIGTLVEVSGLVLVSLIGVWFILGGNAGSVDFFYSPAGMSGILSASALIFFAFIGFEEMVNISEEVKNAKKTMPRAIVLSLIISTLLYILVAVSSVAILGYERLSESKAPLTSVVEQVFPDASLLMSFIALFATGNTVLLILIVASRMLYGLACNHSLPKVCSAIGRRNTPYAAIGIVMLFSMLTLLVANIKTVASLTDVGIFTVYIVVNSALIWLRYKRPKAKRAFKSPVNIGRFPVLAFLGLATSVVMLAYLELSLIVFEAVLILAGMVVYKVFNR